MSKESSVIAWERPLEKRGGCMRYLLAAFALCAVPAGTALALCLAR